MTNFEVHSNAPASPAADTSASDTSTVETETPVDTATDTADDTAMTEDGAAAEAVTQHDVGSSDVASSETDVAEPADTAIETETADTETADAETQIADDAAELPESEPKVEGIPETDELDAIATEIEDIDAVLKNMDKDNAQFDAACAAAEADGTIADRPAIDAYWQAKSESLPTSSESQPTS